MGSSLLPTESCTERKKSSKLTHYRTSVLKGPIPKNRSFFLLTPALSCVIISMQSDGPDGNARRKKMNNQEMLTKDCRPDRQNCINALAFGKCVFHGTGLTASEQMDQDHEDALEMNKQDEQGEY
jgi:hypothetical protein